MADIKRLSIYLPPHLCDFFASQAAKEFTTRRLLLTRILTEYAEKCGNIAVKPLAEPVCDFVFDE